MDFQNLTQFLPLILIITIIIFVIFGNKLIKKIIFLIFLTLAISYVFDNFKNKDFDINNIIDEFPELFSNNEIADYSCIEIINKYAVGSKLKNLLGGSFEIIKVKNIVEFEREEDKLVCLGNALLDDSREIEIVFEIYKDSDGQIIYKIKPNK